MRRVARFYHLNKPKLRQTWNKHNVYNLYRSVGREPLVNRNSTFFQQKWAAKSKTRAYHGDHIQEKKWKRLFSRRLRSVVDMPPQYLAAHDGSEQATGRGSGLTTTQVTAESYSNAPKYKPEEPVSGRKGDVNKLLATQFSQMTPYMQMTYAPLERRLETAIYRALFASSIREARQFCVHGAVKVNGLKMVYPAYQLNPGDMFEVDVERVMSATGVQRNRVPLPSTFWHERDRLTLNQEKDLSIRDLALNYAGWVLTPDEQSRHKAAIGDKPVTPTYLNQMMVEATLRRSRTALHFEEETAGEHRRIRIRRLRLAARTWLQLPDDFMMPPERLVNAIWQLFPNPQWIPRLRKIWLKKLHPRRYGEVSDDDTDILRRLEMSILDLPKKLPTMNIGPVKFSHDEIRELVRLIGEVDRGFSLGKEAYRMPWRPRPYMSAFCFIPRYLEVNPYICAAVYLRHPVARKGLAEVPTPFNYLTSQLAHNWYLERG
ncbi:hypothetical protein CP532_6394 [Ophiocordyceps camponoti-leonardi (nom. inval.)]|nr:hypothetical protein CP532_6394 [Ophiocordyceps camponoti-leonardi (nom. inval.)]